MHFPTDACSEPAPEIAPVVEIAVTAKGNGSREGYIAPDQQVADATADTFR
jgi:hypothetical protein